MHTLQFSKLIRAKGTGKAYLYRAYVTSCNILLKVMPKLNVNMTRKGVKRSFVKIRGIIVFKRKDRQPNLDLYRPADFIK